MSHKQLLIQNLLSFLDHSPTAWHAVENIKKQLEGQGFSQLKEQDTWNIQPGGRYFVIRNGSSICAFIMPLAIPMRVRLLASHTDSPSLKLKPQPEIRKQGMALFGVEIYGAPLLTSWLNRDLGLAGRVIYLDQEQSIQEHLVNLNQSPFTIPQLAIHLDREVNEKGLLLNKQEHLPVLIGLDHHKEGTASYLEALLRRQLTFSELLSFDLFFYPLEKARLIGYEQELIASYRIDSLASVHAAVESFANYPDPLEQDIKMVIFWDNEEVGSSTTQGAASPFFAQTLERILLASALERQDYFRLISQSLCVSIDLAHALHPNYIEKHDPQHQPILGKGIVLKTNAQQRYASDARSLAPIQAIAKKHNIAIQKFANRNDMPCGTTIGPIHSSLLGMPTVDIGCGQLSMHACRELMACQDYLTLYQLLLSILAAPKLTF